MIWKKRLIAFILHITFYSSFGQVDSFRIKIIESLKKDIYKYYVSEQIAQQLCDSISYRYYSGQYNNAINLDEFTYALTKDLRRISADHHFLITAPHFKEEPYNLNSLSHLKRDRKKADEKSEQSMKCCFGDIMMVSGNIGYMAIRSFGALTNFTTVNNKQISLKAAFRFLSNANTIIIDLRDNQGGSDQSAILFSSYFAPQFNTYFLTSKRYLRYDSSGVKKEVCHERKLYTSPDIKNDLTKGKKIFILVNKRTFSVAELVTYKIKQFLPEATIVGEHTTGGENGHDGLREYEYYRGIIPLYIGYDEQNENFSFEAIGLKPDIITSSDSSFIVAYKLALNGNRDLEGRKTKFLYQKGTKTQIKINEVQFNDFVGDFQKIAVSLNSGLLSMTYDTYPNIILNPVSKDIFSSTEFEKIEFKRDLEGRVVEVFVKHEDGYIERFRKISS